MLNFLTKQKIINTCQYGFLNNHSTELALTSTYDQLLKNLNNNKYTCSIFLDLSKAFDTVNHEILLGKLYRYGFRGKIWNLLQSYLSNRSQCTKIGKISSKFQTMKCGVPQGSCLGPLMFLIYVNDLPNATQCQTTLFADDTTLHLSNKNLNDLQHEMNKELNKIDLWMKCNKLSVNYSKTSYMIISNKSLKPSSFKLILNDNNIKPLKHVKYLGVLLDNKLNWKAHISSLCSKLSKICGVFYKLRYFVPFHCLRTVYFSLVQSHLQYSLINWGRANNSTLHPLQIIQNKIIRVCLFGHKRTLIDNLYTKFQVLKLSDLSKLEYAKFMYKFENNSLPIFFNNYFTQLDSIHSYNSCQKKQNRYFFSRCSTNFGKNTLHYLGLQTWSKIPPEIKNLSYIGFKKKLKKHLLNAYETNIPDD